MTQMNVHERSVGKTSCARLFVLFLIVAFSFGGFTFYAAVVVPIGGEGLDATAQGFVTKRVTHVLNAASGLMLMAFIWEGFAARHQRRRPANHCFAALLSLLAACLVVLVLIHPQLDVLLGEEGFTVAEPDHFYRLHQIYLWVSSIQWLATIGVLWLICRIPRH